MYKKIVTSLALTVGLSLPSIASELIRLPSNLVCGPKDEFFPVIEKYKEKPFVVMNSIREIAGVGVVNNKIIIFVNPETKTFTMLEQFSQDLYCVVLVGEGFEPYGISL